MDVYEISIFCPQNPMNDTTQFLDFCPIDTPL